MLKIYCHFVKFVGILLIYRSNQHSVKYFIFLHLLLLFNSSAIELYFFLLCNIHSSIHPSVENISRLCVHSNTSLQILCFFVRQHPSLRRFRFTNLRFTAINLCAQFDLLNFKVYSNDFNNNSQAF